MITIYLQLSSIHTFTLNNIYILQVPNIKNSHNNNFMLATFSPFLKRGKKPSSNNNIHQNRMISGIQLKRPTGQSSFHSSVQKSKTHSSLRTVNNRSEMLNTESIGSRNRRINSSRALPSVSSSQKQPTVDILDYQFNQKCQQSPPIPINQKHSQNNTNKQQQQQTTKQTNISNILKKYIDTNFIQCLISFINKEWQKDEEQLMKQKRFEALKNLVVEKMNRSINLIDDFMTMDYDHYQEQERKMIISLLFKLNSQSLKQFQSILVYLLKKIPEEKILHQEHTLQYLHTNLLQMYNPKYLSSLQKSKQQMDLHFDTYTINRNTLSTNIITKLKPHFDFLCEVEHYLGYYHRQLMKLKKHVEIVEGEKNQMTELLRTRNGVQHLLMDFDKFRQIKQQNRKTLFLQLNDKLVNFHEGQHKKNSKIIKQQIKQLQQLKQKLEQQKERTNTLQKQIQDIKNSIPKHQDASIQVHLYEYRQRTSSAIFSSSPLSEFLQNISTPFSFTKQITSSLINIISTDKIINDYKLIRNKYRFESFSQYIIQWFLIRCGNKSIAQIFTKNFIDGISQLRKQHKRFEIFWKICGGRGLGGRRSVGEQLQCVFFQSQKAWYYLIKIAMMYRQRLSENHHGFQLFPPLLCESLYRIPLRRVYQFVREFLAGEGFVIPTDLPNSIDYYSINQISRYKIREQHFKQQQLQQIHILKQINFDIIVGFILEFIAKLECSNVEKLLRVITVKQKESGRVVGFEQFQRVYRRFYKERRGKVQAVYAKIGGINQYNMMDITNVEPMVMAIIDDESQIRTIFDEVQPLKSLIVSDKLNLSRNINSYENYRKRFYFQFYDFYDTTLFLQEIFKVIKPLVRKKLKKLREEEAEGQTEELVEEKSPRKSNELSQREKIMQGCTIISSQHSPSLQQQQQYDDIQQQLLAKKPEGGHERSQLERKVDDWSKIMTRVPHFNQKILTIEQSLVHSSRRKQMIEVSQLAWRILRNILVLISKE